MKEINISINPSSFPSQYVPDSVKKTQEFGLQIGQAIQYEWFRKDNGGAKFFDQWDSFHKLRLYARAEQSVGKYKNELSIDGDLSYMNLDWTPVPIIPKFIDIVVNGMSDRMFEVKAYAQDAMSAEKRNEYQDNMEADMVSKDLLTQIKTDFGVDAFNNDPEELPETDDELALHMQLGYKSSIELAQEAAINTVLAENKYEDTRKRVLYDLTTLGVGMAKHEFLLGDGVVAKYVDPANVVYSYTEDPNFSDCFYWGEVKTVPINEVRKIDPSIDNEQIKVISQSSSQWYDHFNSTQFYENSLFNNDSVTLLYFNYKTSKKFVYKQKGEKVIQKDDEFNPPTEMMEERGFEKVEKTIDVWYEGVMVMGTNIMLKWNLSENMVRPKSASQHATPNYIACAPRMYKGNIESTLRRMIPFADLIQMTHMKLQQVIQKVVPDGVFIDADGLNEVDLGNGNAYNPEDALRLYFQTGSVIGRSYTGDGEFNNARVPIQELTKNSAQGKISSLIGSYNHYLQMLRDVTGLNEARDGSMPDPNSLVGLQKLAALNSNTATRHILEASLDISRDLAVALTSRVSDALEYHPFKEEFVMQIGKYNVNLLNDIKDLHLYDFGIFIEMVPDDEEKQQLENNIQVALSRDTLDLDDAIDIREIKNVKLANQLLKVKRKRKEKARQSYEMQKMQSQQQSQMQSQQMAAQSSAQKIQMETQSEMQVAQAKAGFDIERMRGEAQIKSELMRLEFDLNMQLRNVDATALEKREDSKEKAKDGRISKQNTQQSKLIEQRANDLPPVNFESNEDTLDGFDLAEFEPR
tara:strand:+ start:2225 stop:4645 length:2421 start_codon:yes stop_codon:yes gene_type:complete